MDCEVDLPGSEAAHYVAIRLTSIAFGLVSVCKNISLGDEISGLWSLNGDWWAALDSASAEVELLSGA
jgi:hypothetical protein